MEKGEGIIRRVHGTQILNPEIHTRGVVVHISGAVNG